MVKSFKVPPFVGRDLIHLSQPTVYRATTSLTECALPAKLFVTAIELFTVPLVANVHQPMHSCSEVAVHKAAGCIEKARAI